MQCITEERVCSYATKFKGIYSFFLLEGAAKSSERGIWVPFQDGTNAVAPIWPQWSRILVPMLLGSPLRSAAGQLHMTNRISGNDGLWLMKLGREGLCHFGLLFLESVALREADTQASLEAFYMSRNWGLVPPTSTHLPARVRGSSWEKALQHQ